MKKLLDFYKKILSITIMTKSQAIKDARAEVGDIYNFGDGYKFNSYDSTVKAWCESNPTDYFKSKFNRAQTLLDKARGFLDKELIPYDGGSWADYV